MFLFLVASGLSLIFGVLRVLNFAHGTFYMLGAYMAWQLVQWLGVAGWSFWTAVLVRPATVAILGGLVERLLLRHLYAKDELYQLLFTYALVLVLSDACKILWGTQQKGVTRPPALEGATSLFGATIPTTTCSSSCSDSRSPGSSGSSCSARARAASSAPPRSTARRSARSASMSACSTPACSCSARFSAGSAERW
jgi:hypothetical protein